jgi:hypothetical protein
MDSHSANVSVGGVDGCVKIFVPKQPRPKAMNHSKITKIIHYEVGYFYLPFWKPSSGVFNGVDNG